VFSCHCFCVDFSVSSRLQCFVSILSSVFQYVLSATRRSGFFVESCRDKHGLSHSRYVLPDICVFFLSFFCAGKKLLRNVKI